MSGKIIFTSISLARSSLSKAAAAQNVQPPNHSQILLIDCGMSTITFGRGWRTTFGFGF